MWHYGDAHRNRPTVQPASALAQSAYDLLLGMRGMAVTLLFLDLREPERPVSQVPGFVEQVSTACLTLGLAAPLPLLDPRTRLGLEVMSGPGILRCHTTAHTATAEGSTRIDLVLPRQIESIQRRKFSRAPFSTAVAFSPALDAAGGGRAPTPAAGLGQALDLSAGGLRMVTQTPLYYGQELFVSFNTPNGGVYRGLAAKVVRAQSDGERHTAALQFIGLDTEVEGQLAQDVFRLQISRGLAKR